MATKIKQRIKLNLNFYKISFFAKSLMHTALTIGLAMPFVAHAYSGITIVLSANTSVYQEFVAHFKQELINSKHTDLRVKVIDLQESEKLIVAENSELVIALGVNALEAAGKLKQSTLVIGVFAPLPTFNSLMAANKRDLGNFSAIVLDQPYARQISLIKLVLPEAKVLGLLTGFTSEKHSESIKQIGEQNNLNVLDEQLFNETELIPKLRTILNTTEALMAIPDPLVYTRETAQAILLTSYRYQKPVFGYSKSYVQAGALAGVYSNTQQLAKQAAEIAIDSQAAPGLLPAPQAPKYFSIAVNYQVAKSLNILMMDENQLHKKMLDIESVQ